MLYEPVRGIHIWHLTSYDNFKNVIENKMYADTGCIASKADSNTDINTVQCVSTAKRYPV